MSVLTGEQIKKRIKPRSDDPSYRNRLLITPLLDEAQIGLASVDVRLGSSIVVPKKTYVESQDVTDPYNAHRVEQRVYDRARLRYHTKFILHPNELILGVTFEYLTLPHDIWGSISSRSSWARLGLVVTTTDVIHPGYKGSLTLQLANLGESPITLYPGLLIAQVIFRDIPSLSDAPEEDLEKSDLADNDPPIRSLVPEGRYHCATEAQLPEFHSRAADREMEFWRDISRAHPSTTGPTPFTRRARHV
jgi:dCTP deaminase